jgi:diguanylate cyclase (GGDEF)-like protein
MAHTIYSYPLIVMVGLSADEQLAAVRQSARAYLSWATAGSILVVLVIASLARMSLQLASSRARVVEARLATAAHDEYLAYHDSLTGLPNRSLFTRLLEQSIHQARRYNRQLAVLFLDLDGFKRVNDTLGHESGDQLLQEVAARLKGCLRDSDAVARIGGDEFVVLLPELDQDLYAERVAQKLLSAVARPFLLRGDEFRVTASVGISTYPQDGVDEETLTQNADTAMYQAKDEGKNNVQFFSETLKARSLEQLTLESGLRHALENREFRLDYQARQENGSSRITGVEALLRWQHPDLGTVAPMQFIPIAEDTRLIVPIGKWVLRAACRQNVAWQQQGLAHLTMAVNLTPQQFYDQHLLADVAEILAETGMDSNLLELELSESLVMRDMAKNLPILTGLKDMGIRIAIDDFGVGYLSLARLKQIPLDTIKIDRTYIRDIVEMDENKDLATAIVAIGRALGLTVVAQGVETKDQADFLRQNVCGELQGFYLNRPLPADQVAELLRRQPGDTEPVG